MLPQRLQQWANDINAAYSWLATGPPLNKQVADLRLDLADAWTWLSGLERFEAAHHVPDFATLLLSIECTCKLLEHALVSLEAIRKYDVGIKSTVQPCIPTRPWPSNSFVIRRMMTEGWCPFTVSRLSDLLGGPTIYYASYSRRYRTRVSHGDYDRGRCITRKLDKAKYMPRHVEEGCECNLIRPNFQEMCRILDDGDLPILRVSGDAPGNVGIEMTSSNNDSTYTTISHVISDGWGNFKDNTMPACQLVRIQKLVDSLHIDPQDHAPF